MRYIIFHQTLKGLKENSNQAGHNDLFKGFFLLKFNSDLNR